ncbi:MAG: hypothetical protein V1870_05745 [Candidatus Aenigmatarchaeota archaeon]
MIRNFNELPRNLQDCFFDGQYKRRVFRESGISGKMYVTKKEDSVPVEAVYQVFSAPVLRLDKYSEVCNRLWNREMLVPGNCFVRIYVLDMETGKVQITEETMKSDILTDYMKLDEVRIADSGFSILTADGLMEYLSTSPIFDILVMSEQKEKEYNPLDFLN